MELSVVIVSWNVRDLLRRCLRSIFDNTTGISFEVFVVDNASADGSVDMVRSEFPAVAVIAHDENFGFARANNQAIQKSRGDFVLLLNPDTEVVGNTLGGLVPLARTHPEAGVIGCRFQNFDGTVQPSVRRLPRLLDHAMILLKLHHLFPRARPIRRYLASNIDPTLEQYVEQVSGTFFCISRAVIRTVGLFDERFFIWYEDVDYCRRARAAGFKILYTPAISIINHGGKSFAQVVALKKQRMMNKSMAQYFRKHHSTATWFVVQTLRPLSLFITWVIDRVVYHGRPTSGISTEKFKNR